jgi:hypothetical protein
LTVFRLFEGGPRALVACFLVDPFDKEAITIGFEFRGLARAARSRPLTSAVSDCVHVVLPISDQSAHNFRHD